MSKRPLTPRQIRRELSDIRGHLVIATGMTTDVTVSMSDIQSRLVNVRIQLDELNRRVT